MRLNRLLAVLGATLIVASACTSGGTSSKPTIKIGSDGFYESKLVAEMYAQVLEKAGYPVERHLGIGARQVRVPAMESGQIDLVPEYVGSGLGYYDKTKVTGDGQKNHDALQAIVTGKGGGLTVLDIAPGQDTNAFVVRKDTSTSLNLTKMSQLKGVQDQLVWGLPSDCDTNPLCSGALKDGYGITYPPKQRKALDACDTPMATALQGKAIDLAELCSTQPAIAQNGFVTLEDDSHTQPAENMAPIVRNDYLAKVDKASFEKLLNDLSAKITTDVLTTLGVEVAVNNKDVAVVAKDWLTTNGFLK